MAGSILGNRVLRKEDPKFLTTGGIYVDDLNSEPLLVGALHATFVRSTVAHANIATRAAAIFHDKALARQFRHARAIDARKHIGGTAGWKGVDVAHRPARPIARLRAGDAGQGQKACASQHGPARNICL